MASADAMAALRKQLDALQAENAALRAEAAELHGFEWFARFVEWFLGRMVIVLVFSREKFIYTLCSRFF